VLQANMGIMLCNFLATFIAIYAIDRAGRRTLLAVGGVGMVR
jgi:hypothetical protein